MPIDFLAELKWRGLFHQCTNEAGLRAHLAGGVRRAYAGFDPTSDSLTIGNMIPMMLLLHLQRAGHEPVVVMGGGTGLIGDPSGKSAERQLMTEDLVRSNVDRQRPIFERLWANAGFGPPRIVNNVDWLGKLGYLEVLRDVGKHFSVNMMIQKDSVRDRLHARDQGISYTEFSYMILQSYDYLYLYERDRVTLQMGGSDQWGNIVGGSDLIRRKHQAESYGLTAPLVTKADGGKFGKTESGAIWLSAPRTSAYAFYQFWLNTSDADLPVFLRRFTLLPEDEIKTLESAHGADPGARAAHRALARAATALIHGKDAATDAEAATKALFSGDIAGLPEATLAEVFAEVPGSEHDRSLLGAGVPLVDLLPLTTLAKSKREAKEFLASGSVAVNGRKAGPDDSVTTSDLLNGSMIALRRGKKSWHLTRWK